MALRRSKTLKKLRPRAEKEVRAEFLKGVA